LGKIDTVSQVSFDKTKAKHSLQRKIYTYLWIFHMFSYFIKGAYGA